MRDAKRLLAFFSCVLALGCAQPGRPSEAHVQSPDASASPASKPPADAAASAWLSLVDAGDYATTWNTGGTELRKAVTETDLAKGLSEGRAPLGLLRSRRITGAEAIPAPEGVQPGDYFRVSYESTFSERAVVAETVMLVKEGDGVWRVFGYDIQNRGCTASQTVTASLLPSPSPLGLSEFYEKVAYARGIPVVSSHRVSDRAIRAARSLIVQMLSKRPDATAAIARAHVRVAIVAPDEKMSDLPEYADLESVPTDVPGQDFDARSRGGRAAQLFRPVTSCSEENILCLACDPAHGQNLLAHELGHTIAQIGLASDKPFQSALQAAYRSATAAGLWRGTYSARSADEYWAVGAQIWFATAASQPPGTPPQTREQLAAYDRTLHALLSTVFEDDAWRYDCGKGTEGEPLEPAPASSPAASVSNPPPANSPPHCPAGTASVAGGILSTYIRGGSVPIRPFCLDVTEVTVAQYERCAVTHACSPAGTAVNVSGAGISDAQRAVFSEACNARYHDRSDHPINCVDAQQAVAYCRSRGKRLPTWDEWEWAARRGAEGRTYPWGDDAPGAQLCWSGALRRAGTCPVGSFPSGDAPGGIHDLSGNVWEWTSSGLNAAQRIHCGGGWGDTGARLVRAGVADEAPDVTRLHNLGFRCAQ